MQLARAVDGIRYGERRVERLKGIAKPVTAVELIPADRRTSRLGPPPAVAKPREADGATQVVRVAAVGVLVADRRRGVALLSSRAPARRARRSTGGSIGSSPLTGSSRASSRSAAPATSAWSNGKLWLRKRRRQHGRAQVDRRPTGCPPVHHRGERLQRRRIRRRRGLDRGPASRTLLKHRPAYGTITRIALPIDSSQIDFTAPTGVTYGDGSVWVADANTVVHVGPKPPSRARRRSTSSRPVRSSTATGWSGSSATTSRPSASIDPTIDQVVQTSTLAEWINGLAVGGGFLWATVIPDDELLKIDENGTVRKTFDVGHEPGSLVWFDNRIWVASDGRLSRVDPNSDDVTDFPVVDRPAAVWAGHGVLYVSTSESPPVLSKVGASETATVSLPEDFLDDHDPRTTGRTRSHPQSTMRRARNSSTTPTRPAPPAPGSGRRSPPRCRRSRTTAGRTPSAVRPGFRFSPPSNWPVTAATIAYSIERALSPGLGEGTPGIEMLGDVVGARDFHAGRTEHVSGISVSGNTLRIRLVAPAGDFLARLSTPYFAAVPEGTPIVSGGVQDHPIPSAGPYYVKLSWQNELTVLERNPNYTGPRPHRLEPHRLRQGQRHASHGAA